LKKRARSTTWFDNLAFEEAWNLHSRPLWLNPEATFFVFYTTMYARTYHQYNMKFYGTTPSEKRYIGLLTMKTSSSTLFDRRHWGIHGVPWATICHILPHRKAFGQRRQGRARTRTPRFSTATCRRLCSLLHILVLQNK
jgi:hypothetical protein